MMYNPVSNYKLFSEYSFGAFFLVGAKMSNSPRKRPRRENNFKILFLNEKYISFINILLNFQ